MNLQRVFGVALFLIGLALGALANLLTSDQIVLDWYTQNRAWILVGGVTLALLGIVLTGASRSNVVAMPQKGQQAGEHDRELELKVNDDTISDKEFLRDQLGRHRQNLRRLLDQRSIYAKGEEPLRLLNQIDAEKEAIREIECKLRS